MVMKQKTKNGRVRVQDMIEEERKVLSKEELRLLRIITRRDKKEKFERCL